MAFLSLNLPDSSDEQTPWRDFQTARGKPLGCILEDSRPKRRRKSMPLGMTVILLRGKSFGRQASVSPLERTAMTRATRGT